MLNDESRYKILKTLELTPGISQRELAKELGISLGKVNYCINALIEKGLVKVNNFQNNPHKRGYLELFKIENAGIRNAQARNRQVAKRS